LLQCQTGRLAALQAGRQPQPERDGAGRTGRGPAKNFVAMRKNFADRTVSRPGYHRHEGRC